MLTNYLIIGIIVTGLAGALGFKLYINEVKSHATTSVSLDLAEERFNSFKQDLEILQEKQKDLQKENKEVTLNNLKTNRVLEGLRNREATVLAKKSLVALRINKAYQKRQKALACTTGDFSLCLE